MKVIYDTQEVQMENLNIPQHVAIILDGNGRWAKKRHLPRNMDIDREVKWWKRSLKMHMILELNI